jgi:hypothetical protein
MSTDAVAVRHVVAIRERASVLLGPDHVGVGPAILQTLDEHGGIHGLALLAFADPTGDGSPDHSVDAAAAIELALGAAEHLRRVGERPVTAEAVGQNMSSLLAIDWSLVTALTAAVPLGAGEISTFVQLIRRTWDAEMLARRGRIATPEDYLRHVVHPKASMLGFATRVGARLAAADRDAARRAKAFGNDLGTALCVADEIVALASDCERAALGDRRAWTYPELCMQDGRGLEWAVRTCERYAWKARGTIRRMGVGDAKGLLQALTEIPLSRVRASAGGGYPGDEARECREG